MSSTEKDLLKPIGPGVNLGNDQDILPAPLLEKVTELDFVEVVNPLSVDFVGQVALTTQVVAPVRIGADGKLGEYTTATSESEVQRLYGLNLRANAAKSGRQHTLNKVVIPAGQTIRLMGNEAMVVVRQLVNAILQREGRSNLLADPHARHEVEERIVVRVGSLQEALGAAPLTVQQQLKAALTKLDDIPTSESITTGASHDEPFAQLKTDSGAEAGADTGQGDESQPVTGAPRNGSGRSKATA